MSINTELNLLKDTKENLRTAIMEKGVVVSSSDLFSTYPTRISQISTQSGTYDESLKKLLDGSYTSYEIPNGTEKLKTDMFRSYTSLASITIPPTIKTVGSYAFKDCTSLNRVNITDLSAWCGIDFKTAESGSDISSNPLRTAHRLYMNGTQITNLVIPSDVTEIKPYVFYSASGFTSVVIPDSVTTIGSDAFKSCSGLNTVEIGTGITSIGTRAFYYCSRLTSITVKAETPPTIGSVVFNDTNNCPIYVPEDSVDAFKTAWSTYADRIVGEGVAYWKLIGSVCETDGSDKNTGYLQKTYEDVNPSSSTYGQQRIETVQDEETCPIPVAVPEFRRIQYIQDVTEGKYLIVDTANNIALNASLIASTASTYDGINANNNYISVDINGDTIEATETTLNAAVDYDGSYLTWADENSGFVYYLERNSNGAHFKPEARYGSETVTPYANNNDGITFKASGATRAIALAQISTIDRFRWQVTTTDSNFDNVRLFKLDE